jgi:Domain of unknown function (DUF4157)
LLQRAQQTAVEGAHEAASKAVTLGPRTGHIGNQAQLRRLEAKTAPGDLRVGPADDPLEREADAVADRVMRMPEPGVAVAPAPLQVSRNCGERKAEEERRSAGPSANDSTTPVLRRNCAACEEETKVQRKAADPGAPAGTAPPIVNDALRSSGLPLDAATRAHFEPRFGYDLSGVRVHIGGVAEQSAREVNAHAYAVGHDIVFGANQYSPGTSQGQALIAHELTHVLQQTDLKRPLIRRRSATDEPSHKIKPAIVKIVAFEGSLDRAIAYVSNHPDPSPDDGATHTPEELNLIGNPLPAGNYTLQQTSGRFYRKLWSKTVPANKSPPSPGVKEDLFRWMNPPLDESKKELKYTWAKSIDVEILEGYYKQFLAGDKGGKGTPTTTVQLVQTAEALHNAGVSTDELRREEERRLDVSRLGGTDTPGDRVTWALDVAQQTLQQQDVARSTRGTLKFDLDRLAKIPPNYVGIVVSYLTDPTGANEKLAISDIDNPSHYTHPLWINFTNKEDLWDTLRRFQRGFEIEVRALAEAVLNATESEILRVQDIFIGSWGYVKNPAQLRNELAKAGKDPEIVGLRQKISEEEAHPPSDLRRTADTFESGIRTLVPAGGPSIAGLLSQKIPKTETEEYEDKLAANREKLNQLVSEKTALRISGLKGFNAERLFDVGTETAQFELSQVLAGGRNTILSARRHLHRDSQFVWGADKIIKGEEEQLGITQGSVLDQIVQGIVSAELSKKSSWEQIWEIIDFLINFLPIPPPAGPILRAISAGISLVRAVDEYAKRGLLNQASFSAYGPSASGLVGELVATAAGTVIDVHASGLMHAEEEISRLRLERERVTGSPKPPESKVPPHSEGPSSEAPIPEPEPPKQPGESHTEQSDIPPREPEPPERAGGGGEQPPPPPPPRPITVKEQSERIDKLLKERRELERQRKAFDNDQKLYADDAEKLENRRGTKRETPDLEDKIRANEEKYDEARRREDEKIREIARVDSELGEIRKQAVIPKDDKELEKAVFERQVADNPGALVGEQISLDVRNVATGDEASIRIDVAVYKNKEINLIDAKFSEKRDLMIKKPQYTKAEQKVYGWISNGEDVQVIPRGDNARDMGIPVGEPIRVVPNVEIHVNTPLGIRVRDYRDTI